MNVFAKIVTIGAAVALSSQPCLAAGLESHGAPLTNMAASAAERVEFSLRSHAAAAAEQKHRSALALTTASDTDAAIDGQQHEQPKRGRTSSGTKTALIVGGVAALAVAALAALSGGGKYKCKNRTLLSGVRSH